MRLRRLFLISAAVLLSLAALTFARMVYVEWARPAGGHDHLVLVCALGCSAIALMVAILAGLHARVVRPLLGTARALVELSRGNLDAPLPPPDRSDELGDMLLAASRLREDSLERRRLEAEMLASRDELAQQATKLNEQVKFVADLVDSVPLGLGLRGLDRRYILVNRTWERYTGSERAQVIGTRNQDWLPPEQAAALDAADDALLRRGPEAEPEATGFERNGRNYLQTRSAVAGPDGTAAGILVSSLDVTEKRATEQALAEERRRLEVVVRSTNAGSVEWDAATNRLTFSGRLKEMLGYAADADTSGWTIFDRIHPADRGRIEAGFRSHIAAAGVDGDIEVASTVTRSEAGPSGERVRVSDPIDYRMLRADGSSLWVHSTALAVAAPKGGTSRYFCSFIDIDESKRAERRILFNRHVVDNAGPMVALDSLTGAVAHANQAALDILGYTQEEVLRLRVDDVDTGFRIDDLQGQVAYMRERGRPVHSERRVQRKDGSVLDGAVTLFLAEDAERTLLVISLTDVTERKEALAQIEAARAQAEEASRTKSDFLANMSHEIRTPMNAIIGMAHLALQSGLDARQRNYIEKVDAAAKSLLGIINDILDFSKIEAGKMQFERRPFRLPDVLEQVATVSVLRAQEKGLELRFAQSPEVPAALLGDALRLGQVLTNLVNNAIKFTDRGRIDVEVELLAREADDVVLRFAVTDTGIGLTGEQMGRLFDAFSQADASTTRKYGGSGLGLSISKRLVEMMDGQVGVSSRFGEGSTFHFSARFGIQGGPAAEALPPRAQQRSDLRGAHLLLVEDNAVNREVALEILQGAGITVDVAHDGAQALERLERGRYDGVLMDCQMPVMDGYEATRRIRADGRWDALPIIAMTANAMAGDREKCLECGMNDHVAKPIDVTQLFDTLPRWIRPAPAPEAAGETLAPVSAAEAPLPDAPGLDNVRALQRLAGNTGLLRRMRTRFVQSQADAAQRIGAFLQAGDVASALREAHALKGLAGTIGAAQLAERSEQLERQLRDGDVQGVGEPLAAIAAELQTVVAALAPFAAEASAVTAPMTAGSPAECAPALRDLAALLRDSDSRAARHAGALAPQLEALGHADAAARLKELAAQYEFDAAVDVLAAVAARLGIAL